MNEADCKVRLDQLISDQAVWMTDLARFQRRLELHRDGKLPTDDAKIEQIAQGQAQYLAAARNTNNAILGNVKSPDARKAEIDRFLHELDAHQVSFIDPEGWRAAVLAAEDWRRTAAEIGRRGTLSMHWNRADVLEAPLRATNSYLRRCRRLSAE